MGVCQTLAAEIRHRIGFAPNNIIQHPITLVLQLGPHAEDIVIRANHPNRAIRLKDTARRSEPVLSEFIIGTEAVELIPMIIYRIDKRVIRPMQIALKLEIVGWIGENQIDRTFRKAVHYINAITSQYLVQRQGMRPRGIGFRLHYCL